MGAKGGRLDARQRAASNADVCARIRRELTELAYAALLHCTAAETQSLKTDKPVWEVIIKAADRYAASVRRT